MDVSCFDDDIDDNEMNSSCAAVSQILLSLEDALPSAAHSQALLLHQHTPAAVHCDISFDSQSTVDPVTLDDDNRLFGSRLAGAGDRDGTQVDDVGDCDETQYMEPCCQAAGPSLVPLPLLPGHYHTCVSVDQSGENVSVVPWADNSPSLLNNTRLLQFVSVSGSSVQPTVPGSTTVMNAPPGDTGVDIEPRAQVTEDACDLGMCAAVSLPLIAVCSVNDSHLPSSAVMKAAPVDTRVHTKPPLQVTEDACDPGIEVAVSLPLPVVCSLSDSRLPLQSLLNTDDEQPCDSAVMNASPADMQMHHVDIQPRDQVTEDACDTCLEAAVSVLPPAVCGVNDSRLPSQSLLNTDDEQPCSSAATGVQLTEDACDTCLKVAVSVPLPVVCSLNDSRLPFQSLLNTEDDQPCGSAASSQMARHSPAVSSHTDSVIVFSHPTSHPDSVVEISDDDDDCPSFPASSRGISQSSLPDTAGSQVDISDGLMYRI